MCFPFFNISHCSCHPHPSARAARVHTPQGWSCTYAPLLVGTLGPTPRPSRHPMACRHDMGTSFLMYHNSGLDWTKPENKTELVLQQTAYFHTDLEQFFANWSGCWRHQFVRHVAICAKKIDAAGTACKRKVFWGDGRSNAWCVPLSVPRAMGKRDIFFATEELRYMSWVSRRRPIAESSSSSIKSSGLCGKWARVSVIESTPWVLEAAPVHCLKHV